MHYGARLCSTACVGALSRTTAHSRAAVRNGVRRCIAKHDVALPSTRVRIEARRRTAHIGGVMRALNRVCAAGSAGSEGPAGPVGVRKARGARRVLLVRLAVLALLVQLALVALLVLWVMLALLGPLSPSGPLALLARLATFALFALMARLVLLGLLARLCLPGRRRRRFGRRRFRGAPSRRQGERTTECGKER